MDIMIECFACGIKFKEPQYIKHMEMVHNGMNQTDAMRAKKDIPQEKPQTPVVLDKDAPPSDSFMEVAAMLDKPKEPPVATSPVREGHKVAEMPQSQQEVKKPKEIKLEYKYSGECKDCLMPVETLVVKVKGQTVTVAFCSKHGQLKEREVADLEEIVIDTSEALMSTSAYKDWEKEQENEAWKSLQPKTKDRIKLLVKQHKQLTKGGKRGKRSKSKLLDKATVQSSVSAS
jgi:hypothetical protein